MQSYEKSCKKDVDNGLWLWYSIKVAAKKSGAEPWQINNNATLKIPNGSEKRKFRAYPREEIQEQPKNSNSESLNKKFKKRKQARYSGRNKFQHESLILAQDERWRRA